MDGFFAADGRDYLRKDAIIQLYKELNTLDEWLVRRRGSATLDLVYGIKLFVGLVTESVFMKLEPGETVPEEARALLHAHLTNKDFSNKHLMKQPCNATGVDYNLLLEHYNTVLGEFE